MKTLAQVKARVFATMIALVLSACGGGGGGGSSSSGGAVYGLGNCVACAGMTPLTQQQSLVGGYYSERPTVVYTIYGTPGYAQSALGIGGYLTIGNGTLCPYPAGTYTLNTTTPGYASGSVATFFQLQAVGPAGATLNLQLQVQTGAYPNGTLIIGGGVAPSPYGGIMQPFSCRDNFTLAPGY